ncbi:MAG: hypothetical protein JXR22_14020 [Prolixibacteraceae bacterium]|nr:hypothetical protein [Prolixibacteraceae bacterium]
MKAINKFLPTLCLLALGISLSAQETNKRNLAFYTKGNFHTYTVHYYGFDQYRDYSENTEMVGAALNTSLGLSGNIPLSPSLTFYPRAGFTKLRGLRSNTIRYIIGQPDTILGLSQIAENRYYLLSTDLLLKYYFPLGKGRCTWVYGGFRTDFFVWDDDVLYPDQRIEEGMNKVNLSYVGGLGIDLWKRFYFSLEYSNNINTFVNNDQHWIRYFSVSASIGVYVF